MAPDAMRVCMRKIKTINHGSSSITSKLRQHLFTLQILGAWITNAVLSDRE